MRGKTSKALLYVSMITVIAVIGMSFVLTDQAFANHSTLSDKEKALKYTNEEVSTAFSNAGDLVSFGNNNTMTVSRAELRDAGMENGDIKIVIKFIKMQNRVIKHMLTLDDDSLTVKQAQKVNAKLIHAKDRLLNGPFEYVFSDPQSNIPRNNGYSTNAASNNASSEPKTCGIINGDWSTYPPTPTITIVVDSYIDQDAIESKLISMGLHHVSAPWSDWRDLVYAEKTTNRSDSCNNGEFRDEYHVYDDSVTHTYKGVASIGYHALTQLNEPNPEIFTYTSPVYWWTGFVIEWHENF